MGKNKDEKNLKDTENTKTEKNTEEKLEKTEKSEKNEKSGRKEKLNEKALADKEKEIEDLKSKLNESEDKYLRLFAEYDNFRKRAQKEKDAMYGIGIADSVEKLLTVLDNLERAAAVDVESTDAKSVVDGVNKILEQAKEVFEKLGVSEIPAKGEKFDPNLHNAVMHEENEDFEENVVSDVFLKGYKIGDKVIRHSMVKVMN